MANQNIRVSTQWEHSITNPLGHEPTTEPGIALRQWVHHQGIENHVDLLSFVEFWGLPPLILFFNMSIGWFGRFALSTECYRTRKLGYKNLNWPRCSAWVSESLALTDGGFCRKQTLYILDYVKFMSL